MDTIVTNFPQFHYRSSPPKKMPGKIKFQDLSKAKAHFVNKCLKRKVKAGGQAAIH